MATKADYSALLKQWRALADATPYKPDTGEYDYVGEMRTRIEKAFKDGDEQSFDAIRVELKKRLANDDWLKQLISLAVGVLAIKKQLEA